MDVVKHYFEYELDTWCGIPEITLLGTVEDWQSIRQRVENFKSFGLEKWVNVLILVLDKFVAAANGKINLDFWRSFYKFDDISGGTLITGWINVFFPYIRDSIGNYTQPNPYIVAAIKDWKNSYFAFDDNLTNDCFPIGLSQVSFVWKYYEKIFNMNFIGGFIGVSQDKKTLALRAELGWAITQSNKIC
jgi:hypothetical protein